MPFLVDWWSNPDFAEYFSPTQGTRAGMERFLESTVLETKHFIIEKKDGSKIGWIMHFNFLNTYMNMLELAYGLVPSERGKGYSTEAAQLMVDYLFLSKDIVRIVATTHTKNVISQKILEKVGFKRPLNYYSGFLYRLLLNCIQCFGLFFMCIYFENQ